MPLHSKGYFQKLTTSLGKTNCPFLPLFKLQNNSLPAVPGMLCLHYTKPSGPKAFDAIAVF
jgi:hypothetical protein